MSKKISICMFLATAIVVLRHSFNVHVYFPDILSDGFSDLNSFVQLYINSLTNIAVPFFFIVSGYLFFQNYSPGELLPKWERRIKSLFIPYIIWNLLLFAFYLIIQEFGWVERFSMVEKIPSEIGSILSFIFLQPALGQFWYIRDLMIFIIASPILYHIYKYEYISLLVIVVLLILWKPIDTFICSSEGMLFFTLGGYLGYHNSTFIQETYKRQVLAILGFSWIFLKLILILRLINGVFLVSLVEKISILAGIYFFWNVADVIIHKSNKSTLLNLSAYSFFIYAFHAPLIKVLFKGLLSILPQAQISGLIVYLSAPVIIIAFSIASALLLRKSVPQFYNLLTGSRLNRQIS